jgi:hypothetical protein
MRVGLSAVLWPVTAAAVLLVASVACANNGRGAKPTVAAEQTSVTTHVKPASSPAWVYKDGAFLWGTDYSFNAHPYYADRSGAAPNGKNDIRVEVIGPWGGYQPVARNWNFDPAPYAYLTFALKTTIPDEAIEVYFQKVGDVPVGVSVSAFKYGPAPIVGQWATYRIPLTDLGLTGVQVYKFAFQDKTGLKGHSFYLSEIGFLPAIDGPAAAIH